MKKEIRLWYGSLNVNQKIALREKFEMICGLPWDGSLFNHEERIEILYNVIQKLKREKLL